MKQEKSRKYREVFFPEGMPTLEDPRSGTSKKTLYAFYGEANLESYKVVLYSQEIPGDPGQDGSFAVRLALLAGNEKGLQVLESVDVTDFMPVKTEFPGNFLAMDGRLNPLMITSGTLGLHVNLWAILSGSGSISGASDFVYVLSPANKLEMVLTLRHTSDYSRIGSLSSHTADTSLFVGDIDGDGFTEIVAQHRSLETDGNKSNTVVDPPAVYMFIRGMYEKTGILSAAQWKAEFPKLVALPRSESILTLPVTDQ